MVNSPITETRSAWAFAVLCGFGALAEFIRLLRGVTLCITEVPWVDEWIMLEELWRLHDGRYGISYLWNPYWGHRIPIPRLIFLLDEQWFHFAKWPLVAINISAQCFIAALVLSLQWRVLRSLSRPLAAFTMSLTAYLLFSSLQMENFIYGMSIQYAIGYGAALAAITWAAHPSKWRFGLSVACALVCTLTMATGMILWPVMICENLLLRRRGARLLIPAALGCALALAYASGYSQPGSGMGVTGMLQRPLPALLISGMYLGGPLSLARMSWGQTAGVAGLITLFCVVGLLSRRRGQFPPEYAVMTAACLFLAGVSATVPLGRMTPEWIASLHDLAPIPGRYFTQSFLFWSFLVPVAYAALRTGRHTRATAWVSGVTAGACAVAGLGVVACTVHRENRYLYDWLNFSQELEAAGSGFLAGVADQEFMARSYPDNRLLDHWTPYLRDHGLALFREDRAAWLGRTVPASLHVKAPEECGLKFESVTPVGRATRITGVLSGNPDPFAKRRDLVFAEVDGTVIGTGRTYYVPKMESRREGFLAYLKGSPDTVRSIYALTGDGSAHRCLCPTSRSVAGIQQAQHFARGL